MNLSFNLNQLSKQDINDQINHDLILKIMPSLVNHIQHFWVFLDESLEDLFFNFLEVLKLSFFVYVGLFLFVAADIDPFYGDYFSTCFFVTNVIFLILAAFCASVFAVVAILNAFDGEDNLLVSCVKNLFLFPLSIVTLPFELLFAGINYFKYKISPNDMFAPYEKLKNYLVSNPSIESLIIYMNQGEANFNKLELSKFLHYVPKTIKRIIFKGGANISEESQLSLFSALASHAGTIQFSDARLNRNWKKWKATPALEKKHMSPLGFFSDESPAEKFSNINGNNDKSGVFLFN